MAYRQEKDVFTTDPRNAGFAPERGNRYQYNLLGNSQANLEQRAGTLTTEVNPEDGIAVDIFKYSADTWTPVPYLCNPGVSGAVGSVNGGHQTFVGGAMGQIDEDADLDVWTISTDDRAPGGCLGAAATVPAGTPYNEFNDAASVP